MHYKSEVEGVVRIPPQLFGEELLTAIEKQLKTDYEGRTFADLGKVMAILEMGDIGEGVLIPGDGAAYYRLKFTILNYTPEINELVNGEIKDIAKFGAFVDFGPFEGMVHVSQTMDDYVSFSKTGALTGKQTKHALKIGDKVRARIVAISMKDPRTPKIGLTMRQPYLGKLEWIEAETKKEAKVATKKASKEKEKE
ncbi:MAG: DNA-directed RNA polymerase [DPANN group archaeon]|nr:DNA-directed RNA polymerase [DPANN group archaeon]